MIPARAYASTAIGGQYGSAVECAVETLGVSWGSLTADQQSYLFNVTTSTEGMDQFAVFRNSMHEFTPSSGLGGNAYYSTLEGSMYAVVATNARRQLAAYLQGGNSGGGGSGGESALDGQYVYLGAGTGLVRTGRNSTSQSSYAEASSFNGRLSLSQSQVSRVESNQYAIAVMVNFGYNSTTNIPLRSYIFTSDSPISANVSTSAGVYGFGNNYTINVTGSNFTYCYYNDSYPNNVGPDTTDGYITGYVKYGSETTGSSFQISDASAYWLVDVNNPSGGGGSGGGDEPTPPVEQPTNPNGPTITGPTINVNTGGNNSSTTTVDLTPILEMLRIINDNIGIVNGNITDFETWFYQTWQNYVDWLQLWFERFGLSLDNIYAQQELVGNNIVDELREIEDVLWNIFYKPDPEYPTSTPYDDTELQGILNGMWADNNGYLNSIQNLLMQISGQIDGLDDVYTPHVGTGKTTQEQLDEDVARLKRKFPFSIPWDLYALLQFLQAPPSAPTFSFTLPYMGTLQCDLSVFDDVAAVCRWVSLLWFVAGLLACTNKLLNLMNVFERND